MKKIVSKHQRERKQNIKQWAVGIILIGVMLFGIIGYSFQGRGGDFSKKIKYNGFEFVAQGDYWVLNLDQGNFVFNYNPEEIERIEEYLNPINNYYNKPLYVFSESNSAEREIYQNLFYNGLVQRFQGGCPENETCKENVPTKTCEDNFIIIKESDSSKIYQQENCVFIEGKREDLIKLTDGFLFKILGIS